MIVKRTSPITGREFEWDLPVTQEQLTAWKDGTLIQDAMPHLTDDQREFLMTGITPKEWEILFDES